MKRSILTTAIAALVSGLTLSGIAQAATLKDDFSRRPAGSASGSGDTVEAECPVDPSGNSWQDATASLVISQTNGNSTVEIEVGGAAPNTLYTVWVRMKGAAHGASFGGSPITGGGATPLAPSSGLAQLVADWVGAGSSTQPNGFTTNSDGEGVLNLSLDFPVLGGSYPFNRMDHADHLLAQTKNPNAQPIPTTIVNPTDAGIGGPFMLRIVSHCQDGLGHGLSPSKREAWFQYP
ncbi:MAG: hypothetical protein ABFS24_03520 [Pseudomonadota bacterium]